MCRREGKWSVLVMCGLLFLGAGRLTASPQDDQGISDSAITSDIQAKLFQDSVLKTLDIRVSTQEGVVTLSGTVKTDLERAAVDRIASTEPGVVKVVDGLTVAGLSPAAASGSADVQYSAPAQPAAQNRYSSVAAPADASIPSTLVLPAGTLLTVRLTDTLSSDRNRPGDSFTGMLEQPLVVDGWVVARRGQTVLGRVAVAQKGGRVKGVSQLGVELSQITLVDGQQVPIRTQLLQTDAGASKGRDASAVGSTTGVGATIGAIAGGGEGAGIGAAAGAAAGIAGVLLTRGRPTVIPSETLLTFRLESPVSISTGQSQSAFLPVNQRDYGEGALRYRPQRFAVAPYPYYASPYPFYYGWGPYYSPFYPAYYGPGFVGVFRFRTGRWGYGGFRRGGFRR